MNKFEKLLQEAEDNNIKVHDFDLGDKDFEGLYIDGNIALSSKLQTYTKKACILAEELGHHYTTVGNILDQRNISNQKQERTARIWAYEKIVPKSAIYTALENGYTTIWDISEYLDVDEEFLKSALIYYGILDI